MKFVLWLFPFAQGLGLGVLAMLMHEFGHLIAALLVGLQVKSVGIKWNKGLYTVRQQGTPIQNLLVAAAGPLTNLLLIAATPLVPLFGLANFCYALANLLPVQGSDGLRILTCLRQIRSRRTAPTRI